MSDTCLSSSTTEAAQPEEDLCGVKVCKLSKQSWLSWKLWLKKLKQSIELVMKKSQGRVGWHRPLIPPEADKPLSFEASLVYKVSSEQTAFKNLVSKKQNKKPPNQQQTNPIEISQERDPIMSSFSVF